ncbi:MAG: hypothetical protein OEO77_00510 [Acidimicrobiia bacterium]|nr:hypothetical protein [Acidimicrobiia bacterium]
MRKLPVVLSSVVALMLAFALPVGAFAAKTLPLTADCGDRGTVTFHIIAAEGSLVGFESTTGQPVVFHGVEGAFVQEFTIDSDTDPSYFVEFEESFLKGKGNGLQLTSCEVDSSIPIEMTTLPLNDETSAVIFSVFGIEIDPDLGNEVTITGKFVGIAMVQFPGR